MPPSMSPPDLSPVYEVAEILHLTYSQVEVTGFYPAVDDVPAVVRARASDGQTFSFTVDEFGESHPLVSRVRPAEGEPQIGEIWSDSNGWRYHVIPHTGYGGSRTAELVSELDGAGTAWEQTHQKFGPLRPVYRPGVADQPEQPADQERAAAGLVQESGVRRARQRACFAAMVSLMSLPLPELWSPRVSDGSMEAMLAGSSRDLPRVRRDLHAWAGAIDDAEWTLRPHLDGRDQLSVAGTWNGVGVMVFELIAGGHTLEELSAPVEEDEPAAIAVVAEHGDGEASAEGEASDG